MKIILAGGGTGGSATPLLAVAFELKKLKPDTEFLFVGTENGPEKQLVEQSEIKFVSIPSGKLRRYFSFKNLTDLIRIMRGYFAARKIITQFKPDLIFSAGSFVGVPVAWAARWAGVKVLIHQQDARIGLANKLVASFADYITTSFEKITSELPPKTEWVGNPVRPGIFEPTVSKDFFHLTSELPILLIFGGATGATQINDVLHDALPELVKAHQVIHITGRGKSIEFSDPNYHQYEFLGQEYFTAINIADIVVARAGLSTIAELSALGKIAVIVPMPDSHQEDNAAILKQTNSAVVLDKDEFNAETLARVIVSLKFNVKRLELLSGNMRKLMPHDSATRIAKIIIDRYGQ